jgi:hypothetical protein
MITLPPEAGMDSTNEARIQPIAGTTAPPTEPSAHPASRQVASSRTQNPMAPAGAARLYWKLPTSPSAAPSRNRAA